jgi:23S rRNA pseudouridine1911/1915/1917 synthase
VGDFVYGNEKSNDFGQYLHAKTLGFTHPKTGEWMEFDSDLPKEFQDKINELREESNKNK